MSETATATAAGPSTGASATPTTTANQSTTTDTTTGAPAGGPQGTAQQAAEASHKADMAAMERAIARSAGEEPDDTPKPVNADGKEPTAEPTAAAAEAEALDDQAADQAARVLMRDGMSLREVEKLISTMEPDQLLDYVERRQAQQGAGDKLGNKVYQALIAGGMDKEKARSIMALAGTETQDGAEQQPQQQRPASQPDAQLDSYLKAAESEYGDGIKPITDGMRAIHGLNRQLADRLAFMGNFMSAFVMDTARAAMLDELPQLKDDATFEKVSQEAQSLLATGRYGATPSAVAKALRIAASAVAPTTKVDRQRQMVEEARRGSGTPRTPSRGTGNNGGSAPDPALAAMERVLQRRNRT